jgi:hypothetical protein
MRATLIESPDEHHWMLLDHRVTQLVFDARAFRMQTWSLDSSVEIRLAGPFTFVSPRGGERRLDPEQTEGLAPVLGLLRRPVQSLTITRAGDLVVALGDGAELQIGPSVRGDAWEVVGAGSMEGMGYRCATDGRAPWE